MQTDRNKKSSFDITIPGKGEYLYEGDIDDKGEAFGRGVARRVTDQESETITGTFRSNLPYGVIISDKVTSSETSIDVREIGTLGKVNWDIMTAGTIYNLTSNQVVNYMSFYGLTGDGIWRTLDTNGLGNFYSREGEPNFEALR